MTEVRKESLSALIDGEASEIEVHRLVREFRSDETLSSTWAVYQKIRTTARRDADPLSIEHHHQLFERISSAVEAEEQHDVATKEHAGSSQKVVFGSLALAASLVVAIFIGVQPEQANVPDAPIAATSPTVVSPAVIGTQPVAVQPVSAQPASVATTNFQGEGAPELVELDEEKQERLRAYLRQHDRMSRMNPDKQFVNYSGNGERAPADK